MKTPDFNLKLIAYPIIITSFFFLNLNSYAQLALETKAGTTPQRQGSLGNNETGLTINKARHIPGKLIVKLKEGATIYDIQELNNKYNVALAEKLFKDIPSPEEALNQLKNGLTNLNPEHQGWYWQLDKNSQEYKDYMTKIESEKKALEQQIKEKEALIASLEQRQKRATEDTGITDLSNIYVLNTSDDSDINAIAREYSSHPAVEYAEPDFTIELFAFPDDLPNDTYMDPGQTKTWASGSWGQSYEDLWGLKKIKAHKAWSISQGKDIIVAVVDTGVDYNHEDITDNIWRNHGETSGNGVDDDKNGYTDDARGWDCEGDDNKPMDKQGHGTHLAGIIAAQGNNGKGIIGVAPKAKIMAIKVTDDSGHGGSSNISKGLRYAADNGADVISMSTGIATYSKVLKESIDYAYSKGCLIIAAAGNDNANALETNPACFDNVMAIASTDISDKKSSFSNYGSKIDVSAPGGNSYDENDLTKRKYENILSLRADGTDLNEYKSDDYNIVNTKYYRARGTSMACPYAAGIAALILKENPSFSITDIKRRIIASTDQLDDYSMGSGRINAYNAVKGVNLHPHLKVGSAATDNVLSTGTTSNLTLILKNNGEGASNVNATITCDDSSISITKSSSSFGNISADNSANNSSNPFRIKLNNTVNYGKPFEFKLSITASGNYTRKETFIARAPSLAESGWPITISDQTISSSAHVILADLNNDSQDEIVFFANQDSRSSENNNYLYAFTSSGGSLNSNWPVYFSNEKIQSIAAGDLDNNGENELLLDTKESRNYYKKIVYKDGSKTEAVSLGTNKAGESILGDIDNDGKLEIIFIQDIDTNTQKLFAYDYLGNQILASEKIHKSDYRLALGDTDGDGYNEIAGTHKTGGENTGEVFIVENDGAIKYIDIGLEPHGLTLGDINNDGKAEIIVYGTYENNDTSSKSYLLACSHSSGILWKKKVGELKKLTKLLDMEGDVDEPGAEREPIICNVDSEQKLEVLIYGSDADEDNNYTNKLYCFNHDGTGVSGWPVNAPHGPTGSTVISFIAADIDNDSKMEILLAGVKKSDSGLTKDYIINAWNNDGTIVDRWPLYDSRLYTDLPTSQGTLAVGNTDNDNKLELVLLQTDDNLMKSVINLFTLGENKGGTQWPMYRHNVQQTGCYKIISAASDTTPPSVSITSPSGSTYTSTSSSLSLSGSASDAASGIAEVKWSNNKGGSGTASGTTSWSISGVSLSSGDNVITVTAKDGVGNSDSASITVKYSATSTDITPPSGTIIINSRADYTDTTSLNVAISASDNIGVTYYYLSTSPNTPSTSNLAGWTSITPTTSYSASTTIGAGGTGSRTLYCWFRDDKGNISSPEATDTIYVDIQAPNITITSPTSADTHNATTISIALEGNASDDESGIKSVKWKNEATGASGDASGSSSWSTSSIRLSSSQDNAITVTVRDMANNSATDTITVKCNPTTGLSGSITINNGALYATANKVTLNLKAEDDEDVYAYQVSPDNIKTSSWIMSASTDSAKTSYAEDVSYNLQSGDGTKTIYVWYKDIDQNESGPYSDNIILDTVSPTISITGPTSGSTYTSTSSTADLSGSASDAASGVAEIKWSNSKGGSGSAAGTTNWSVSGITLSSGDNVITVTAKDYAGLTSSASITITYTATTSDTNAPTDPVITINGGTEMYATSEDVTVNLVANDNVGVTGYYVSENTNNPLSGSDGWVSISSKKEYYESVPYTLSYGDGYKYLYACYKDAAGNVSSRASTTIILDTTTNTTTESKENTTKDAGVIKNTTKPMETLSSTGIATTGSNADLTASSTGPLRADNAITTTAKDNSGPNLNTSAGTTNNNNTGGAIGSAAASTTVTSTDNTPRSARTPIKALSVPIGSVNINNGDQYAKSKALSIKLSAVDNTGVKYYGYTINAPNNQKVYSSGWKAISARTAFSTVISYTASSGDGKYTVYAWYKDAAGNISNQASGDIILDTAKRK